MYILVMHGWGLAWSPLTVLSAAYISKSLYLITSQHEQPHARHAVQSQHIFYLVHSPHAESRLQIYNSRCCVITRGIAGGLIWAYIRQYKHTEVAEPNFCSTAT
jgi:hypothetical protein